jgi:hypothetical protein
MRFFQCTSYACPSSPKDEDLEYVPVKLHPEKYSKCDVTVSDRDDAQVLESPDDRDDTCTARNSTEREVEEEMRAFLRRISPKDDSKGQIREDKNDKYASSRQQDIRERTNAENSSVEDFHIVQSFFPKDNIDLEFVEQYDHAFNEFLTYFPRFLITNPELMHRIRVLKLQKILDRQTQIELSIQDQWLELLSRKRQVEEGWQEQLREAAARKAARQTHLQSYLNNLHYATRCREANGTWQILCNAQYSAKKEHWLRLQLLEQARMENRDYHHNQNHNNQEDETTNAMVSHRQDLLKILPEGTDFEDLTNAMLAPAGQALSEEQMKDLHQLQTDNAYLAAEVAVMKRKLAYQKATTKQHAWVESVLLRLDEESFKVLKHRFQKKVRVPL